MDYKLVELNNRTLKVFENGTILVKKKDIFYEKKLEKQNKGYLQLPLDFNGKQKMYYVHRIIGLAFLDLDITDSSKKIDHIDRNPLNNNVSNLRIVTHQQNGFNRGAKGYSWNKSRNKWQARIAINGKNIYIGVFENEDDAHNAYLNAKLIYHIIT